MIMPHTGKTSFRPITTHVGNADTTFRLRLVFKNKRFFLRAPRFYEESATLRGLKTSRPAGSPPNVRPQEENPLGISPTRVYRRWQQE